MEVIELGDPIRLQGTSVRTDPAPSGLRIILHRNARFSLFAEAPTVQRIQELASSGCRIQCDCTYPIGADLPQEDLRRVLGPLYSPLGLTLASTCESVCDSNNLDVAPLLHQALWEELTRSGGRIGTGSRQAIISRDPDYAVPVCLREGLERKLAMPPTFRELLIKIGRSITGSLTWGSSQAEENITTLLYEAAQNCHQHARATAAGDSINGVRGILIDKLTFNSMDEVRSRRDIPGLVEKYIDFVWHLMSPEHVLMSITIADNGDGIHNTLPALPDEPAWQRLQRAFAPGSSRLPPASGIQRGLGLPKILDACRNLRAFLFLRSAELSAYVHFGSETAPPGVSLCAWPYCPTGRRGTALTVLWPIHAMVPGQGFLFPTSDIAGRGY